MAECEHLARTSAYFDGALAPAEEGAAAAHLATCAECQAVLGDAVGIDVALSGRARVSRRRWPIVAAFGLAAAAAVAVWLAWPPRHPTEVVAIAVPHERALEARFTGAAFAAHRPLAVVRGTDHAREQIALAALADLERRNDVHALVAALASSGDLARAEQLATQLPTDAASETDRAAVALAAGDLDRAVAAAYRALERDPQAMAAAWNLALAARELGLPRVAKRAFERVAAAGEPGWSDEARRHVGALERDLAVDTGFAAFDARATAMVAGGAPLGTDDATHYPARSRFAFLDAARLAPDRARLDALRPLASALDHATGQGTATAVLERIDPAVTVRFAPRYRAVVAYTASPEDTNRLITELRAAGKGADDMRAGAIITSGQQSQRLDELATITGPWHDPWFALAIARERIHQRFPGSDLRAEQALLELGATCARDAWAQRCGSIEQDLAELAVATGRYDTAQTHAMTAMALQRASANPSVLFGARALVAEIHRLRGQSARARAEFEDLALAVGDRDCDLTRYAQIGQTEIAIVLGDWDSARRALPPPEAQPGCSAPVDLVGVTAAVDLARHSGTAADRAIAERWLAAGATLADRGAALVGALRIAPASDPAAARTWIDAHRTAADPVIAGVRTWGVTTLIDDAASRGAWREIVELVHPPDAACRVVASADDEAIAVAIATPAGFDGERTRFGAGELGTARLVSDRLAHALADCPEIAVSARPPLHGRSDLLPPQLPWWFAGDTLPHAAGTVRSAVEVTDARPPDPTLAHLAPAQSARAFEVRITGEAATPTRVLSALATASYAELHVHGLANASDADAAYLALSPDSDGRFALRADAVRAAHLTAAPLVVLAACRGAVVAPYLRQRWSLPDAFVAAGATAVVAAEVAIPDADARRVFDELHRRIDAGDSPARAVAAIRAAEPAGSWARHLMVFR